jgi:predicted small secreted protein
MGGTVMARKLTTAVMALLLGATLAGCNTIAGFGKDMERAGEKVQGAAKK